MASIFGDESADAHKQRVFAVSGLIGTNIQWDQLKDQWSARTGGVVFHATDCESDQGDFKDRPHIENLKLYEDLTKILVASEIRGYASALDIGAWLEFFPGVDADLGYYKCFTEVLLHYVKTPQYHDGSPMEFTFDNRQESNYPAGLLYHYMVNLQEWQTANLFLGAKVNFDSSKDIRIQAADLLAREAMKFLDNYIGPKVRPMRRSFEALASANSRFLFEFMNREYCADRKAKDEELQARTGMTRKKMAQWFRQNGLSDNWPNRFRYIAWIEAEDKKQGL